MSFNIPDTDKKRVVIVGGGFGGLKLAHKLDKKRFQVVLIDKNNYHQFPPLLYQVASSGLDYSSISFPFRKLFRGRRNFYFRLAEVKAVAAEKNRIETTIGTLDYDYLVLAAGTTTNFFGNETIQRQAWPMKTVEEALALRDILLVNFEKAAISTDPYEKQALLNIVVVGGGATGVEISGALSEMKRFILPKDYPDLGKFSVNIYLVEGSPKILGAMSASSSSNADRFLRDMGVKIMLNKKVVDYKEGKVILDSGETIDSETLVWVSGVTAVRFDQIDQAHIGHGGRIRVNAFNQVEGFPNLFAIGDICLMTEENYPKGHPQVAQVAIQQGKLLAKNLERIENGRPLEAFHYKDLGTLATVGRNRAVGDLKTMKLHGFTAWAVWMLVHLRSILGVKNKLVVLIDWIWNYFTYDRSMRFILYIPHRKKQSGQPKKATPDGAGEAGAKPSAQAPAVPIAENSTRIKAEAPASQETGASTSAKAGASAPLQTEVPRPAQGDISLRTEAELPAETSAGATTELPAELPADPSTQLPAVEPAEALTTASPPAPAGRLKADKSVSTR